MTNSYKRTNSKRSGKRKKDEADPVEMRPRHAGSPLMRQTPTDRLKGVPIGECDDDLAAISGQLSAQNCKKSVASVSDGGDPRNSARWTRQAHLFGCSEQNCTEAGGREGQLPTVWFTVKEVAKRFKVSEREVRRWIADGELKAARFGRMRRISLRAILDFERVE